MLTPTIFLLEIRASNPRFAGSTGIYAGLTELSEFADRIGGFPSNPQDERNYEFGTPDKGYAAAIAACTFDVSIVSATQGLISRLKTTRGVTNHPRPNLGLAQSRQT